MASTAARSFPTIKAIRTFVIDGVGSGGDYHNVKGGHWYVSSTSSMAGTDLLQVDRYPNIDAHVTMGEV
jgi:hypothetical protein